ncbi:IclR family transcriptional regulator [Halohasta litchfieldiae]|jgi:DNA-binding IclR family transcriptional regulator|uniref:Transcriptional regulator, IclR family n=1 Tax=Halohasta litchfieldiae TaxID=1073996 RepID=A0A1H6VZQ4_9EURY|nr:IclR family transcriptional regulator [Halohasta litchfieldiae]ATW89381.1 IclR family transcriptional regulator [Halohasta litchfieldiae]SEJ05682.1 transcriptional regulator, IclR family [Halohasta litchfieldiae]
MVDGSDLPVAATQTSVRILETLIDLDGGGVTAVAEALGRSKSSVHNHLETLTGLGFVVKDDHEYRVSLRFLHIGSYARQQYPIYTAGIDEVVQLSTAANCSAGIVVLEADSVICLHHRLGPNTGTPRVGAGDQLPLHTAAGKAILAALPEARREDLLADHAFDAGTEQSYSSRAELDAELQTVTARGLAVDREEWYPDMRGIAAAVEAPDGSVRGAIYVLTDTESLSGKRFQQDLPGLVISSATQIQNTLRESEN